MNINHKDFELSFEIFPPRDLNASFKLWRTIEELAKLTPKFISVTYGAGGSTCELSQAALSIIAKEYKLEVAGHLTCMGSSKKEVMKIAEKYAGLGAKRIVALRGDLPTKNNKSNINKDVFSSSIELISALKSTGNFQISVAAYPNIHPEAKSEQSDLDMLRAKFDAGADNAITQFFFEAEDFLRFRDKCRSVGINQKIIPGILPIENWAKTKKFTKRCGLVAPEWMNKSYENCRNKEEQTLLSKAICTEICDELIQEGINSLHFYTLNDPYMTREVCKALGRKFNSSYLSYVA
ncbi:methylenetetrahydrofolate reductase [NAD(P)H] [Amylibacter sp.]|nr:methylenetetrahydrofolate reductase [NAD(P)H] [Amylibacter sp.]